MLLSALISSQGHGGPSKADPRPAVQELRSARHGGRIWVEVPSKSGYRISFSGCKFNREAFCMWRWNRTWISSFLVFTCHCFRYDRVKWYSTHLIYVLICPHLCKAWQNPHCGVIWKFRSRLGHPTQCYPSAKSRTLSNFMRHPIMRSTDYKSLQSYSSIQPCCWNWGQTFVSFGQMCCVHAYMYTSRCQSIVV